jgi:hypothetical protein
MTDVASLLDLTIEEQAALAPFVKDLDSLTLHQPPVLQDTEISKIEANLASLVQEIINRGRQQSDKSNA